MRLTHLVRRATLPLLALALLVAPTASPAAAQTAAQDLYNQGRSLLQSSDFSGAVESFTRAINADPNLSEALLGRATAYVLEGNLTAALEDYNRALQMQGNLPEALYNRGIVRAHMGDAMGAVGDLQRAAELFRDRGDETTAGLALNALDALQQ